MGNQLSQATQAGGYQDQQVLQQRLGAFQAVDQLGGGRFLKSFLCFHDEGQLVMKVRDPARCPRPSAALPPCHAPRAGRTLFRAGHACPAPAPAPAPTRSAQPPAAAAQIYTKREAVSLALVQKELEEIRDKFNRNWYAPTQPRLAPTPVSSLLESGPWMGTAAAERAASLEWQAGVLQRGAVHAGGGDGARGLPPAAARPRQPARPPLAAPLPPQRRAQVARVPAAPGAQTAAPFRPRKGSGRG